MYEVRTARQSFRCCLMSENARPELESFALAAYLPALPEVGIGANPRFATLTVTSSFIGQLLHLQSLCRQNDLIRVEVAGGPDSWGIDPKLFRIDMPTLVVQGNDFWFREMPMDIPTSIQTYPYRIDKLQYLFDARLNQGDGSAVFLANDPLELYEIVQTSLSKTSHGRTTALKGSRDPRIH
jgi:hypothetical protein